MAYPSGGYPDQRSSAALVRDDGGLGVVRIKPLGAGGGGGEASAVPSAAEAAVAATDDGGVLVRSPHGPKKFTYPRHVIGADCDQEQLYNTFMPQRVDAFLRGINVNIMAYGQTGSGKTHTMFGPPGLMAEAGAGTFGMDLIPEYGLCPRGLLDIHARLQQLRESGDGMRYALSASAVELTFTEGNLDMFVKAGEQQASKTGGVVTGSVSLDKAAKPPRLYGMTEAPVETETDIHALFAAIASRNTASTGLNDSSSRSHCFVFLTLRVLDTTSGRLRTSRFQFVDLAGNERLKDAHGAYAKVNFEAGKTGALEGMITNYSLMMLSRCVRDLVAARSKKGSFSFRTYMFDLIMLLQESLVGTASTLVIVCCSSAPDNASTSTQTLEFGEVFSKLEVKPPTRLVWESVAAVRKAAEDALAAGRQGANAHGRFGMMRQAQARDALALLSALNQLQ